MSQATLIIIKKLIVGKNLLMPVSDITNIYALAENTTQESLKKLLSFLARLP